ncbi:MAG: class I SAM-dependent DNA methyltransferase, partial [Gemmatimonadetes bacterium]|nr:class I SAM-dependent DNA methyltransferase [Gemmatimonadota bacterium]
MRLSWNEIRIRAAQFAQDWKDAGYEKGETQSFYNDFFDIFDVKRRTVARYEEHVQRLDNSRGFIDLFWPGVLLVEQKSAGINLAAARKQAGTYFDALPERDRPRYQLLCDFQTFELLDRDEREEVSFALADLPKHVEKFGFILGVQKRTFRDQDPVNIEASERVGQLHDALAASGYTGHDLEQFLVRIVFCLFADDTGIFEPRDIFFDFLENRTQKDGSDLGGWLAQLFQILNTPEDRRPTTLDEDLNRFPYINGDLFRDPLLIPSFNSEMRQRLIDACTFDWSSISPAIFGSLFQSVMDKDERRARGAHYTTEKNILKVIEPLFLDALRAEFLHLKSRRDSRRIPEMIAFQQRLGELRFFDPACGCGNFLIIAYRELRTLEIEVLKEIRPRGQLDALAELLSVVDVDQFYGIELGEFPAHIAEVALWMMDHLMNNRLSLEFGQTYARIPLEKSPHIWHGDALEIDWNELLPAVECSYLLGNPPFVGANFRSPEQREQVRRIAALGKSGDTLDYVTAWFIKAGEYVEHSKAQIGFVATNSITQGEQVAQLWPILFDRCKLDIAFAHRTFAWGSDARGMAQVHV